MTTTRTRTDTISGTGTGPTAIELHGFLTDCPPDGQVRITTDKGDQRDPASWSITVTSQVGAANIGQNPFQHHPGHKPGCRCISPRTLAATELPESGVR